VTLGRARSADPVGRAIIVLPLSVFGLITNGALTDRAAPAPACVTTGDLVIVVVVPEPVVTERVVVLTEPGRVARVRVLSAKEG